MKQMILSLVTLAWMMAPVACNSDQAATNDEVRDKHPYRVSFQKSGIEALLTFEKYPTKIRVNAPFELKFWDPKSGATENGPYIDPGFVLNEETVHPEMVEHGHGTSPVDVKKIIRNEGTANESISFRVDKVFFTMKGEWEIQIDVKENGKTLETGVAVHQQQPN